MRNDSNLAKMVSIDPGTDTVGIALYVFDPYDYQLYSISAHTLHTSRQCKPTWISEIHSDRMDRLYSIKNYILDYCQTFSPNVIACESPYISMRTPNAFSALTEAVFAIRAAVIEYDSWVGLTMVDPTSVKKSVGVKGKADSDKDKVKNALLQIPEIVKHCAVDINDLDEHSVDAIAVGYHTFLNLRTKR